MMTRSMEHDELDGEGVTVPRNEGLPFSSSSVLCGLIEITLWDSSVIKRHRWEQGIDIAMLADEAV